MENNTNEVVKKEEVNVTEFLNNHKLTDKAKFLYKNGFHNETFQEGKMDAYKDVTHNDGFKNFSVYTKGDSLFIAKPETDEEDNIISYNVIELAKVTDEELNNLIEINAKEDKTSLSFILKIAFLVLSVIGSAFAILYAIRAIIAMGFLDGLAYASANLLTIACALGICALLFKKK